MEITFDEKIAQIIMLWNVQRTKAKEAETLLLECEGIETSMRELLEKLYEENPVAYQDFLESFQREDS
jgi:hypothetical protein